MKKAINRKILTAAAAAGLSVSLILGGALSASSGIMALADTGATPVVSNYEINNTIQGKTYYVSPDAVKGEGDGSEANPYTVEEVIASATLLQPGDTVIVKNGVYTFTYPMKATASGSPQGYITVKKEDAEGEAVFSFYDMVFASTNRGVEITGDYWHWDSVDICGAGDNGMYIGGSFNVVENCEFYDNRDSGLQLGRSYSEYTDINDWPSYNLIKNCTSYNNYDNETYGENADGFAAKLTVGYGNIFDGCIAYRNSDDGWDLYAKVDSGNIGAVMIYNCVAFENGYIMESQEEFNAKFPNYRTEFNEVDRSVYTTRDGDGNGFKLGGSVMEGDVFLYNCMAFNNRMHGVTDNSNPGVLDIKNITSYNNSATVDANGNIVMGGTAGEGDKCGNINMSRQTYSYNIFSDVLSVNNGSTTLTADEYRGAAEYSIFDMGSGKANKVTEWIDASSSTEAYAQKGTSVNAVTADVFEQLPITWTLEGTTYSNYVYNLTGKGNVGVDAMYRNADNSINMGAMLAIKESAYADMFGADRRIGADLTGTSWEDYTHCDYVNASGYATKAEAEVASAHATLYINTEAAATFQDFDLITRMENVNITWQSSDTSIISINTDTETSYSGTHDARAIVYRGEEDQQVTLTATITSRTDATKTVKKDFVITVKADVPTIGDVVVEGIDSSSMIGDQYSGMTEPAIIVLNAADYNGKALKEDQYTVETVYMYAPDKTVAPVEIHHFTAGVAGIYNITKTVTLGNISKSFTYTINMASSFADVQFTADPTITVNKEGYIVSGEPSSVTGVLYSYSSATAVNNITAEQIIAQGEAHEFRGETVAAQFTNANNGNYYIYSVMTNTYGDVTSDIYTNQVTTVNIATVAEFKNVLLNNNSSTIYLLTADLDLSGETNWEGDITSKKVGFKGLLNGNGHTISNLTVSSTTNEQAAMFYKLDGGTIENVKFHNITINGNSTQKFGLIATSYGGYIYNVALTEIQVSGGQRGGLLVGQVMLNDTYIDQVSVTNERTYSLDANVTADNFDKNTFYVLDGEAYVPATEFVEGTQYYTLDSDITGDRISGIVGFIQASSTAEYSRTYITNCYVNAVIGSGPNQYVGSIVGRYDDRNANDYLSIQTCFSNSTLMCTKYQGGIIGGQSGAGVLVIKYAMFTGTMYYGANLVDKITTALKNCSGIMGYYSANARATITQCYAKFEEYNSNYNVDTDALVLGNANQITFWEANMGITSDRWTLILNQEGTRVQDPYVTLNFLD